MKPATGSDPSRLAGNGCGRQGRVSLGARCHREAAFAAVAIHKWYQQLIMDCFAPLAMTGFRADAPRPRRIHLTRPLRGHPLPQGERVPSPSPELS